MKGWLSEEACKKMFALSGLNFDETIAAAKKPGFKSFTMKAKSKDVYKRQVVTPQNAPILDEI